MKKVLAVTLNPCVDYTIVVPEFKPGKTNLSHKNRKDLGGKGLNVCSLLFNINIPAVAAGFDFMDSSVRVKSYLEKKQIPAVLTEAPGEIRVNIKILDGKTGKLTEINQPGPAVRKEKVDDIHQKICEAMDDMEAGSVLVLAGSVPEGVPEGFYGRLIKEAKRRNILTVVDAAGNLLVNSILEKPDMIKPNRAELEQYARKPLKTIRNVIDEAQKIYDGGVRMVCVSLGREGAVLVCKEGVFWAKAATVPTLSFQGAGDAMVAAMSAALIEERDIRMVFRMGMAAANATVSQEGTQMAGPLEICGMMDLIEIEEIK